MKNCTLWKTFFILFIANLVFLFAVLLSEDLWFDLGIHKTILLWFATLILWGALAKGFYQECKSKKGKKASLIALEQFDTSLAWIALTAVAIGIAAVFTLFCCLFAGGAAIIFLLVLALSLKLLYPLFARRKKLRKQEKHR